MATARWRHYLQRLPQALAADNSEHKFLIGIGIDEQLQWATAKADSDGLINSTIRSHARPLDDNRGLEEQLVELFDHLAMISPRALREADAIGIGTIGLVETENHFLRSISRKPKWLIRGKDKVFDFGTFIVSRDRSWYQKVNDRLLVHNDTSAIALAEFSWGIERGNIPDDIKRLLYLRFDEGVNGGIIDLRLPMEEKREGQNQSQHGELLPAIRHPEMGHIRPRKQ